ncbi:hypothetical protein [Rhodococcus sp. LB1]|uniref:hypothetical protein n=1 Tax=Rhodococcus sp. LB1 TaxID=1807499 RepID=UPI00077B22A7|nr:hypothetical protein [Rhodococcus sp. LB1]KXX60923.1 hypothetical protein AZG88_35795 [Rhodococcus sp. LB1]
MIWLVWIGMLLVTVAAVALAAYRAATARAMWLLAAGAFTGFVAWPSDSPVEYAAAGAIPVTLALAYIAKPPKIGNDENESNT